MGHNYAKLGPISAVIGANLATLGQRWLGNLTGIHPLAANVGHMLAEIGQHRPTFGKRFANNKLANIDQLWQVVEQVGQFHASQIWLTFLPNHVRIHAELDRGRPKPEAGVRPNSVVLSPCWPNPTKQWPNSDKRRHDSHKFD